VLDTFFWSEEIPPGFRMKDGHASPSASSAATTMTSAATGSWARIGPATRSGPHPAISHSPLPDRSHPGGQPDRMVDTFGTIPSRRSLMVDTVAGRGMAYGMTGYAGLPRRHHNMLS